MKDKEIKKEYYEAAIRGDLQNETDMIDIDAVWNWFEPHLQKECSLPSDEEIDLQFPKDEEMNDVMYALQVGKRQGAKWMRDKFQSQKDLVEENEKLKEEENADYLHLKIIKLLNKISALEQYNQLLGEEINEIVPIAASKGWKSTRFERGEELRNIINDCNKKLKD